MCWKRIVGGTQQPAKFEHVSSLIMISQAPADDDPTAAIVSGPSSHEPAASHEVTPSSSELELPRLPEHARTWPKQPPPLPVPVSTGQPGQPVTPRQEGAQQQQQVPGTPKDMATEALRSTLQTLSAYLDRWADLPLFSPANARLCMHAVKVKPGSACMWWESIYAPREQLVAATASRMPHQRWSARR